MRNRHEAKSRRLTARSASSRPTGSAAERCTGNSFVSAWPGAEATVEIKATNVSIQEEAPAWTTHDANCYTDGFETIGAAEQVNSAMQACKEACHSSLSNRWSRGICKNACHNEQTTACREACVNTPGCNAVVIQDHDAGNYWQRFPYCTLKKGCIAR